MCKFFLNFVARCYVGKWRLREAARAPYAPTKSPLSHCGLHQTRDATAMPIIIAFNANQTPELKPTGNSGRLSANANGAEGTRTRPPS